MRFPWPKTIKWRLTASYTLASIAASVVILFLGAVVAASLVVSTPAWPLFVAADALTLTPQLRPLLEQSPPANPQISTWLHQLRAGIEDPQHQRLNGFSFSFDATARVLLLVADAQGKVLASTPEDAVRAGESLQAFLPAEEQPLLRAALQGVTDQTQLSQRSADGAALAIVPIRNKESSVLGVLLARIHRPFIASEFVQNVFRGLPVRIILVAPCAALFGFLFGILVARRFTRRLELLSHAASEWGRGNLAVHTEEPTPDELGQLAKQLNKMAADVQELLLLRQDMAALDERHRLARELHDSVKQQIFAANMQISAARASMDTDPRNAALRLDEAQKLVGYAQRELTDALRELRPAAEHDSALTPRLRDLVSNWAFQNNLAATFTAEDHPSSVSPPIAHALFRIAQEALANIARHSGATRTSVQLSLEPPETLKLTIKDDGIGFTVSKISAGMGLNNMRERAESLPAGRFVLVSKPGKGTQIEVSCATISAAAGKDERHVR